MSRRVMLEFADHKVCAHCGAPAARLGHEYDTSLGEIVFDETPVMSSVVQTRRGQRLPKRTDAGAGVVRVKNRGRGKDGFGGDEQDVLGIRYTHICRREVTDGRPSCGVLTEAALGSMVGDMPDDCYIETPSDGSDPVTSYRRLLREVVARWSSPK